MSLPTARRMGAAVDPDDFLDRLARERDAAIEARCPHGLDVDDCSPCAIELDAREKRRADR